MKLKDVCVALLTCSGCSAATTPVVVVTADAGPPVADASASVDGHDASSDVTSLPSTNPVLGAMSCSFMLPAGANICDDPITCDLGYACPAGSHVVIDGDLTNSPLGFANDALADPWCKCTPDVFDDPSASLETCAVAVNSLAESDCAGTGPNSGQTTGRAYPLPGDTLEVAGHFTCYEMRLCSTKAGGPYTPSPTNSPGSTTGIFTQVFRADQVPTYENGITTGRCQDAVVRVYRGLGRAPTTGTVVTEGPASCVTGPSDVNGNSYCILQDVNALGPDPQTGISYVVSATDPYGVTTSKVYKVTYLVPWSCL